MKDGIKARAVNRLDRNTSGIVCFALNEKSRAELEKCFRDRLVTKKYRALVVGVPEPPHAVLRAFLFKDAKKSRVYISDVRKTGYVPIETEYFVTDKHDGFCGVEIILHTGRTHQIRAHMAHIGHPVVGDGKYSSAAVNRRFGRDTQALAAVEYRFHLPPDSFLGYLNSAVIKIDAPF